MKAQDYQHLHEGYWKSKKEEWGTHQNSDEHVNSGGKEDVEGYFEAGCDLFFTIQQTLGCKTCKQLFPHSARSPQFSASNNVTDHPESSSFHQLCQTGCAHNDVWTES